MKFIAWLKKCFSVLLDLSSKLDQQQKDIEKLQNLVASLDDKSNKSSIDIALCLERIDKLVASNENSDLKNRIQQLYDDTKTVSNDITSLKVKTEHLKCDIQEFCRDNKTRDDGIKDLECRMIALEAQYGLILNLANQSINSRGLQAVVHTQTLPSDG